ncbi:MAG: alpha/beta hydrolase [Anaerolineae bacterium]|nr:alpha/beta hydrolase [Anaerolineae bacterium]
MKKILRTAGIVLAVLLLVLLVGPFLVPVPPLENTAPPEQLADPDSQFVDVNGLQVHYKLVGEGEPALILLHGFAASLFSWREVMAPLAEHGTVVAFDRPAFGLTERPLPGEWAGENPYSPEAQVALTVELMDALGIERAVLVGNSAGGTVAMNTALQYPQRVAALVLVDAAVYHGGGSPALVRPLLRTPQMRHLGPLIARQIQEWGVDFGRSAWHDPSLITDEIWAGYTRPLQAENWDRALWELMAASRSSDLADRLDEVSMPALVITGDDDRIVPTAQSIRLAGELPDAELVVVPNAGHVPHEERPDLFVAAVIDFLDRIEEGQ